jgi:three-Cys-motif partner protein
MFSLRSLREGAMSKQRTFAVEGTKTKLETVFDYAEFYTTALKNKGYRLTYVDVFAGTGELPLPELDDLPMMPDQIDVADVIEGSAKIALQVNRSFDRYVFNDAKKSNAKKLDELKKEHSDKEIHVGDKEANELIQGFCSKMRDHDRALMFLDPFGNQVDFDTLRLIADTKRIDLWYLFPSWWGVVRQIKQDGTPLPDAEGSIDRIFGTRDWRSELLKTTETKTLFGDETVHEKIANVDNVTRFMIERMKTIFGDGVSEKWLPLTWKGRSSYSLLFACSNPAANARKLAMKVSREVMTRK